MIFPSFITLLLFFVLAGPILRGEKRQRDDIDRAVDWLFKWVFIALLVIPLLALVAWLLYRFPWFWLRVAGAIALLPLVNWLAKLDRKAGVK